MASAMHAERGGAGPSLDARPTTEQPSADGPAAKPTDLSLADHLANYSRMCERRGQAKADRLLSGTRLDQMMSGMINEIVGGIFAIALGLVLLNQLFAVSIIDTANGSFSGTFDTVESIGGAALTFAILGMLALAGGTAVRMFRT